MAKINMNRALDAGRMSYSASNKTFSTEASTVGYSASYHLYDDALDVGVHVISPRTGKSEAFVATNIKRDREGDIMQWEFSGPNHWKLVIFND